MNRYLNNLKYALGLLAIVTGAIATFDNSMMPSIRYVVIYGSILVISAVLLHSVYVEVDETDTLEKIRDEQ